MAQRDDAVAAGMQAIGQATQDALGKAFDAGVASVPPSQPSSGISADQEAADIAAAVAGMKSQIDDLTAKLGADDAKVLELQAKLDKIKELLA